jgi:hypothetical protein
MVGGREVGEGFWDDFELKEQREVKITEAFLLMPLNLAETHEGSRFSQTKPNCHQRDVPSTFPRISTIANETCKSDCLAQESP